MNKLSPSESLLKKQWHSLSPYFNRYVLNCVVSYKVANAFRFELKIEDFGIEI